MYCLQFEYKKKLIMEKNITGTFMDNSTITLTSFEIWVNFCVYFYLSVDRDCLPVYKKFGDFCKHQMKILLYNVTSRVCAYVYVCVCEREREDMEKNQNHSVQ